RPCTSSSLAASGELLLSVKTDNSSLSLIFRSELSVSLHQWHRAEIWCTGKGILMKVDRQSWVESQLISIGSSLTEPGMLYIGGFDDRLALHLPDIAGFHGCVKKIRVNGHSILLRTGSDQSIRECGADPCAIAGCPQTCTSNNDDYLCLCEWPKYGRKCEIAMRFSGHSYLELKKEEHMSQITGDSLKMEINLKISNSTVFEYVTRPNLSIKDNTVQVMMNLGSGLVSLTHPTLLIAERWTRVGVKRRLTLTINDATPITTISPGDSEQLNVYKGLYIGKETSTGGMPHATQDLDGFRGCIGFINIGLIMIDHPEEVTSAINIEDCDL
uniref:LAM_G_DOMAIN domain-containing protein n=1 Tax=Angiostrongylus cantonensis TaxID=6313 RepID=A0A0K0D5Q3_ANGCA